MLKINDKTFLNIQEAVQWLMDNNALPFQCTANYAANTEIGLGTIVNPTMAKVRIGSLIFFADSKVSTVTGITANGFIVSDQYNDLVDDVVYVSNVQINASGHLIVTLSNGTEIDAGLIKQVASFSIDALQHLIATYNDGSTNDLGAIFSGNISISGNIYAAGNITTGGSFSGNMPILTTTGTEIVAQKPVVEDMSGFTLYSQPVSDADCAIDSIYVSVCKNGNKVTFVIFGGMTKLAAGAHQKTYIFDIPTSVGEKLFTFTIGGFPYLDYIIVQGPQKADWTMKQFKVDITKASNGRIIFGIADDDLTVNQETYFRIEKTFILSENLAS